MKKVLRLQKIRSRRSGNPKPMGVSVINSKRHTPSSMRTTKCAIQ